MLLATEGALPDLLLMYVEDVTECARGSDTPERTDPTSVCASSLSSSPVVEGGAGRKKSLRFENGLDREVALIAFFGGAAGSRK